MLGYTLVLVFDISYIECNRIACRWFRVRSVRTVKCRQRLRTEGHPRLRQSLKCLAISHGTGWREMSSPPHLRGKLFENA